jgi:hypothetical protein
MKPTQPKTLEEYKALVEDVYATCEGAGGHYKDALFSIAEQIAEFYWPNLGKKAEGNLEADHA